MKKLAFSMLVGLAILNGCQPPKETQTEVSILIDITGSNGHSEIDITTNDVLEIFNLNKNPFNYGKFRISTLTETHLAKIDQAKLRPVKSMSEYNQYSRESEIKKFQKTVDDLLAEYKNLENGKQASSIFIPLSKELRKLSRSNAQRKVLIVYTDLFENSSFYSSYSDNDFSQNPAKLTEILMQNAPLPNDLKGIQIFIIYNPVLGTDSQFLAISKWYKKLLEKRNAEVFISANLILD